MIFAEATSTVEALYTFKLDIIYAIPLVYFISLMVGVLLREFTRGALRYSLAVLFVISHSVLWIALMLDNNPWQFVLPVIVVFGVLSGLSKTLRAVLRDLQRL